MREHEDVSPSDDDNSYQSRRNSETNSLSSQDDIDMDDSHRSQENKPRSNSRDSFHHEDDHEDDDSQNDIDHSQYHGNNDYGSLALALKENLDKNDRLLQRRASTDYESVQDRDQELKDKDESNRSGGSEDSSVVSLDLSGIVRDSEGTRGYKPKRKDSFEQSKKNNTSEGVGDHAHILEDDDHEELASKWGNASTSRVSQVEKISTFGGNTGRRHSTVPDRSTIPQINSDGPKRKSMPAGNIGRRNIGTRMNHLSRSFRRRKEMNDSSESDRKSEAKYLRQGRINKYARPGMNSRRGTEVDSSKRSTVDDSVRSKTSLNKKKQIDISGLTESEYSTIPSKTDTSPVDEPPEDPSEYGEEDENNDEKERKRTGLHCSRCMLCTLCFCYLISIVAVAVIALFVGMHDIFSVSDKVENFTASYNLTNDVLEDFFAFFSDEKANFSTISNEIGNGGFGTTKQGMNLEAHPSRTPSHNDNSTDYELQSKANLPPPTAYPSKSISDHPSTIPSLMPSTSFPSTYPSFNPSLSPSLSTQPSTSRFPSFSPSDAPSHSPSNSPTPIPSTQPSFPPSYSPSSSPTDEPKCPERLLKSVFLDQDKLLQLRYDVVLYKGSRADLGGLLCVSLEYTGAAGWIGVAFSEATRNPQFGRKEAIIGIPGMRTSRAVVTEESGASLGQQLFALEGGPLFVNPGKYEIPAGGIEEGFTGPSPRLLRDIDKQTLMEGSVFAMNAYLTPNDFVADFMSTNLSFEKYLQEPGEIEINPYKSTLLLYAVASLDHGGEYDGNPEWRYTYLNFLDNSPDTAVQKAGPVKKRKREHKHDKANGVPQGTFQITNLDP